VRSLGFNWDFAPVLDVNNNPANPVIAERSFSEDPNDVTRLAGAWMRGALRERPACYSRSSPSPRRPMTLLPTVCTSPA
jgi:beta-N-acetylhexosaminidase